MSRGGVEDLSEHLERFSKDDSERGSNVRHGRVRVGEKNFIRNLSRASEERGEGRQERRQDERVGGGKTGRNAERERKDDEGVSWEVQRERRSTRREKRVPR